MPPISCTSKCRIPRARLAGLPDGRKASRQDVVQLGPVGDLLAEVQVRCFSASSDSASVTGSSALMRWTTALKGLDLAFVDGAKEFLWRSRALRYSAASLPRRSRAPRYIVYPGELSGRGYDKRKPRKSLENSRETPSTCAWARRKDQLTQCQSWRWVALTT